jgi:predicted Ser/Thr protein kinase
MLKFREEDRKIEETRIRLDALVVAKGFNMKDPEVIALSDELDRLIVDFEKAKKTK